MQLRLHQRAELIATPAVALFGPSGCVGIFPAANIGLQLDSNLKSSLGTFRRRSWQSSDLRRVFGLLLHGQQYFVEVVMVAGGFRPALVERWRLRQ
jgi:hypothetical protein